jgi:hypothetical protein
LFCKTADGQKQKKITLGGNARAYQELFAKPNYRLEKKETNSI